MSGSDKIAKLEEKIAQCSVEISECKAKLDAHSKMIRRVETLDGASHSVLKIGIILSVIAFIVYMCDVFHWIVGLVAGVPLLAGIILKILYLSAKKRRDDQYGDRGGAVKVERELQNELAGLERKQARFQRAIDLEEGKPEALHVYRGKDWNLRRFEATPARVKEMELDLENLYVAAWHTPYGTIKIEDNWMCRARRRRYEALHNGKTALQKEYDKGFLEMGKSGSWKLQVGQVTMLLLDMALDDPDSNVTDFENFKGLYRKENVRDPETKEEKEYFELAMIGSTLMAGSLQRFVKLFGNDYRL